MKTLKISDAVHKELKVFSAQQEATNNMTTHADLAIIEYLRVKGHKFSKPTKKVK